MKKFRFAQVPSPSNKTKNKAKASQIVPVVILIVSIVGALYFTGFFNDFTDNSLSDAGKLIPQEYKMNIDNNIVHTIYNRHRL